METVCRDKPTQMKLSALDRKIKSQNLLKPGNLFVPVKILDKSYNKGKANVGGL